MHAIWGALKWIYCENATHWIASNWIEKKDSQRKIKPFKIYVNKLRRNDSKEYADDDADDDGGAAINTTKHFQR